MPRTTFFIIAAAFSQHFFKKGFCVVTFTEQTHDLPAKSYKTANTHARCVSPVYYGRVISLYFSGSTEKMSLRPQAKI